MSDVRDQDCVIISPELNLIFQKHFNKVYMLSWFDGFIRSNDGKTDISEAIRTRYADMIGRNERQFAGNETELRGTAKFRSGVKEFLADFEKLTHSDIHILKKMTVKEALGTHLGGNKFAIETINNKPIKLEA